MGPSELEVAAELVSRYVTADPIVAAVVAEAARFAPLDGSEADPAISSSRLFLGAIDCTAADLEQGALRDLRRAFEGLERGPAALSRLRTLFRRETEDSPGPLSRLSVGLSQNASNIITTAGKKGRATEATFVDALLSPSGGRLSERMMEFGVDLRVLRDAYSTIRQSATPRQAGGIPRIERVRLAGLAAYEPLYRALRSEAPEIWLRQFAGRDSEARASIAGLPAPDEDLPLRVLVSLAHEARSGSLEWFYAMAADGSGEGQPVSEPLRKWLESDRELLNVLFPEVLGGTVRRVWENWKPPQTRIPAGLGRFDWDTLVTLATDLTRLDRFAAVGTSDHWLILILIRDGGPDLSRLVNQFDAEAIDRATDRIVREMAALSRFSGTAVDGASLTFLVNVSFLDIRQAERELAGNLPVSVWTIFAVLIIRCPKELSDTFGHEFTPSDAQQILEEARRALGLAPGVATADRPPQGHEMFSGARPEARATRDFWTADDSLGYRPFADAIAGFIRHKETRPPFTIGIKAQWGSGKTSLMRMVQNALDPRQDLDSWKPKDIRIDPRQRLTLTQLDSRRAVERGNVLQRGMARVRCSLGWSHSETPREATIWDLLERITRPPAKDAVIIDKLKDIRPGIGGTPREDESWRPTVWFNPWMYQTGEQTWAGLANEIINQIGERLDPIDREWFWLQLNLRRLNRESVRRRVHAAIFQRVIPGAVVAVTVLLLAVMVRVASLGETLQTIAAVVMPLSPLGFLFWGGFQLIAGLRRRVGSAFPDLVEGPKAAERLGDLVRKGAEGLGEAFEDPSYASKMGFLYLIQTDMKRVLDLIATKDQPLVVFVDDLDRCSPGTVAQVIEAVNLFLAGEFPNCIFVLAMEPDIVAAHVEVEHEKLVQRLGSGVLAEEWTTLGWRFLDKIVQLPLSIPEPDDQDKLRPFLDGLLGEVEPTGGTAVSDRDGGQTESASKPALPGTPTGSGATVPSMAPPTTQAGDGRGHAVATATAGQSTAPLTASGSTASSAVAAGTTPSLDLAMVALLVETIEAKKVGLSIAGIRNAARTAQAERSGVRDDAPLSPEAVAAARQVFERLLSERNPTVRGAIESGIDLLGPRNPRQVKRFINLFRFYAFIEAVRTFSAADDAAVADLTAVAKVAAIAIRWPSLVSALTRTSNGHHNLDVLEESAANERDWGAALAKTGLLGAQAVDDEDADARLLAARRFEGLRDLLARGPKTAALGRRLL